VIDDRLELFMSLNPAFAADHLLYAPLSYRKAVVRAK